MQPVIRRYEAADLGAVIGVFLHLVRDVASKGQRLTHFRMHKRLRAV